MKKEDTENLARELFGENFQFRKGQAETIEKIVENTLNGVKQTVLEAPTGSGKSIIGMMTAYVLYRLYGKKSYILVSDLSLYRQYEKDIEKLRKKDCFGCLKGKENYTCWKNGCSVSQAVCSLNNESVGNVIHGNTLFSCRNQCKYMEDYEKAVNSPITLMTYQLYFIQRNYVKDELFGGKNKNFPKRDLVICDECHNLCDICQNHFAPVIEKTRPEWMDILDNYGKFQPDEHVRKEVIRKFGKAGNTPDLIDCVKEYEAYINRYSLYNESLRNALAKKKKLSKADKAALAAGNMARQSHCKISDLLKFVNEFQLDDYIVKTETDQNITVNFIFDNVMLLKYFHNKSDTELLMSATIGDFRSFASLTGLDMDTYREISMPSSFDFEKSPVYYSSENRMSFFEKDMSIKNIVSQVIKLCRENSGSRGIIQTGSYYNSNILRMALPMDILRRCIFYEGSKEKNMSITRFKDTPDAILVGPTLIEGLDFPDDMCRFIICIKVPYAYLGNEYVKKKKDCLPGWYEYDALNKLCQGIGRGVRNENNWCRTYILDGCVKSLVKRLEKFSSLKGRFRKFD